MSILFGWAAGGLDLGPRRILPRENGSSGMLMCGVDLLHYVAEDRIVDARFGAKIDLPMINMESMIGFRCLGT